MKDKIDCYHVKDRVKLYYNLRHRLTKIQTMRSKLALFITSISIIFFVSFTYILPFCQFLDYLHFFVFVTF